jgi:hypothetical protein
MESASASNSPARTRRGEDDERGAHAAAGEGRGASGAEGEDSWAMDVTALSLSADYEDLGEMVAEEVVAVLAAARDFAA